VFHKIKNTTNVKEVWDKLKKEFEGKSRSMLVDLGRKFQTMHCREDDDVHAHFSKLANLCKKLSALGRNISDDEYVAVLIGSLPSCYDGPINSLTSSCNINNVDITPTAITWAAIQEYEKHSLQKENKSQDEVFAAAEADKRKSKKDIECFNCKRKGHYKSECWAKGSGNEGGGQKKPQDKDKFKNDKDALNTAETESLEDKSWAVIVKVDNAPSKGEHYVLTASLALTKSKSELYDSGASHHMSPFQHHFTNLCSIPPHPITAANNHIFYATGLNDLKIDVPNGSSSTSITLKDTLYAPDMTLTVISISKIANAGYAVSFKGQECKIPASANRLVVSGRASDNSHCSTRTSQFSHDPPEA